MNKFLKHSLVGMLIFDGKKILLRTPQEDFFVRSPIPKKFLHGDTVSAFRIKSATNGRLAEVSLKKLIQQSEKILLGRKNGKYIEPLSSIATLEKLPLAKESNISDGSIVKFIAKNYTAHSIEHFENSHTDTEVGSILFLYDIHTDWNIDIRKQEAFLQKQKCQWKKIDIPFREDSFMAKHKNILPNWKNNVEEPYFSHISDGAENRVDIRNWYTLTIDGTNAKDLDDAISIARCENGNFLLGVHIADVSHFVTEKSPIDHEARSRGTSIYLPNQVIPMLPETLSNHLCSLNPETYKKTISCLLYIDQKTGKVLQSDIVKSLIHSKHRGVYHNIFDNYTKNTFTDNSLKVTIQTAFELFSILQKRRKKEGKIHFETTELYFHLSDDMHVESISKRERNEVHMLIEEFMVIANEEVAKWCHKRKIPFLSRFHDAPNEESEEIIWNIIGKKSKKYEKITSKILADYLESLDENSYYFASRMILPKMSKAIYSTNRHGHFGLALQFYSHFTSPIRRYPDLVTHRMIHEYLDKKLSPERKKRVSKFLQKTAELSSHREKVAENIENAVDKIYILRFISTYIGKIFSGKISGVTEWGIFVELENGIEVTVYLPRFHNFQIDTIAGAIIDKNQKKIFQIGEEKTIKIMKILQKEGRIIGEFMNT